MAQRKQLEAGLPANVDAEKTILGAILLDNVTGGWETESLDDSQLPGDFVIDYVRVWQRNDLATPEDGPKPNDGGPSAKN